MKKVTVLLVILLSCLVASTVAGFGTVNAQTLQIDLEFVSSPPAYVDQPFEISATVSGGTPPFSYQWYTKWFPPWMAGMDPDQYRASGGSEIAVPGAVSSTFWFTLKGEGIYWISVGVSDSTRNSVSHYPSIQSFQLIVHNNTVTQTSPSPSTIPPFPTPTIPEIPPIISLIIPLAVLLIAIVFKKSDRSKFPLHL
jgi:hypothetical protein